MSQHLDASIRRESLILSLDWIKTRNKFSVKIVFVMFNAYFVLVALISVKFANSQICDSNNLIDGSSYLANDAARYSSFLQLFTDLRITCAGTVTKWGFVQNGGAFNQQIYLDVWRSTGTGTYSLVRSTLVTAPSQTTGVQVVTLTGDQRFTVQVNDVIGMHYSAVNKTGNNLVVPYLDPEKAPATSATIVWRLSHQDILNQGSVISTTNALVTDQQRLPGLLAYITTTTSTNAPTSTITTTQTPVPVVTGTTPKPIVFISIGNFGFQWPGVNTPPSLIITSAASSLLHVSSASLWAKAILIAVGTIFFANMP